MDIYAGPELATVCPIEAQRWTPDSHSVLMADVAEEVPVALEYNGVSHAVMLASPADLEDFALGFSLTEGILRCASELYDSEVSVTYEGIRVAMRIAQERFFTLKEQRRNLTGRTGCGLCGTESLKHAVRQPEPVMADVRFPMDMLHQAVRTMMQHQSLRAATGATHAAAWLDRAGCVTQVREDVGRHNALDKLIGALTRAGTDFGSGAIVVTSRASYEMVQKAASVGTGMLVAVSAPTALAVRLAEASNVTLVGCVRRGAHTIYTHPQRLQQV